MHGLYASLVLLFALMSTTSSAKLDPTWPKNINISEITPLFDFDQDSCYPSIAFDRHGEQSGGLKPTGPLTGGCRPHNFLDNSNTYHRYACMKDSNVTYCGHMFTLYFQKDQVMPFFSLFGHRHDFEEVIVWTIDGNVTHGSASAHGRSRTKRAEKIPREGQHLKFVYHKEGLFTHSMRFAMKKDVETENSYGAFVLPPLVSWYTMQGDGPIDNQELRGRFNRCTFGGAHQPGLDGDFVRNLNEARPYDYPEFTEKSMSMSK
ncbi:hypothetical protein Poli38472_010964 [Pythium oligandrum]|uniref:Uncharacterized protein n=1 Tax=Pythium oligandrum TaxID=41045 RepID=A0A8K1CFI5_PYTOL|nr:hypothetical protein Poli38472_010964 [Pythium oligandrum]|eukprot:TMW61901.1 hypothetical protein Poli38472_010964 [Pythium oligandrum]